MFERGRRGSATGVQRSRYWLGWLLAWAVVLGGERPVAVWADIAPPVKDRIPIDRQIPVEWHFSARGNLDQYRFYLVDEWLRPNSSRNPDHTAAIVDGGAIEVAKGHFCRVQPLELLADKPVVVARPLDHWPVAERTQLLALPRDQARTYESPESLAEALALNAQKQVIAVVDRLEFKGGREPGSPLQRLRKAYVISPRDDGGVTAAETTEETFTSQELPWWQPNLWVGLALAAAALSTGFFLLRWLRANVGPPADWGSGETDDNGGPGQSPVVRESPVFD
jgi:hypothetical protein